MFPSGPEFCNTKMRPRQTVVLTCHKYPAHVVLPGFSMLFDSLFYTLFEEYNIRFAVSHVKWNQWKYCLYKLDKFNLCKKLKCQQGLGQKVTPLSCYNNNIILSLLATDYGLYKLSNSLGGWHWDYLMHNRACAC